jgi:hypothetical protein
MKLTLFFLLIVSSMRCVIAQHLEVETISDTLLLRLESPTILDSGGLIKGFTQLDTTITTCTLSMGFRENELRTGRWNFYECSKLRNQLNRFRQDLKVIANYEANKLIGTYISFYSDSLVKSEFTYDDDLLIGEFKCYNENGVIIFSGIINEALDDNYATGREYYSTGSFKRERKFLIGYLKNEWMNKI